MIQRRVVWEISNNSWEKVLETNSYDYILTIENIILKPNGMGHRIEDGKAHLSKENSLKIYKLREKHP